MKKLICLLILLIAVNVNAGVYPTATIGSGTVATIGSGTNGLIWPLVYVGTITGLRLSILNGTAFIDNAAALTYFVTGEYLVEVTDSGGKKLTGYIKEAGTGETLDSDLVSGWDFTSGWTAFDATIDSAVKFTTSGNGGLRKNVLTNGALYKASYTCTSTTAGHSDLYDSTGLGYRITTGGSAGGATGYGTSAHADQNIYVRNYLAGETTVSAMTVKQVLTPSTSGVTIVSTKSGSTYNFTSKEAGFLVNEASYTVKVIYQE